MTKRMLIDSTHAEETRVVVLDGNRLEDFDVETSTKRQLKGNIYLAKVVRVEPSLQAAFVEYGGNRHGFLAFGEIHPDYYQIPVADRKRLLEAQEAEAREQDEADEREAARAARDIPIAAEPPDALPPEATPAIELPDEPAPEAAAPSTLTEPPETEPAGVEPEATEPVLQAPLTAGIEPPPPAAYPMPEPSRVAQPAAIAQDMLVAPEEAAAEFPPESAGEAPAALTPADLAPLDLTLVEAGADLAPEAVQPSVDDAGSGLLDDSGDEDSGDELDEDEHPAGPPPEQIGGENDTEDRQERRAAPRFLRNYKIQEVIRRRQIMLIQVVKEERGTKGAALTTYISLAGRFSVLMPNSPRGGGISRKITSATDRRRLKEVMSELDLPRGMGLIVRTAGANRPKPEIIRDCEALLNQWDAIRDLTMRSVAPALIYEEASLIKRAIRDLYSRDVDDILVDGEQGWRAARDFMRMLMPTHARKVQLWKDPQPLFAKAQVETQLDSMMQPTVQLRSGGYLVINQAEALVAIDVNSGRSTRERGIEETALRTNLEAAEEVARQLRLRDLAGLVVIDFIDMESRRNNAAVERKLKEALKYDRARIQVGSISHFGLLEMSRQRLRPSIAETSFVSCPHCAGTGYVRSTESSALHVLRAIEDEGGRRRSAEIVVHVAGTVALYILNHKRARLSDIEQRYGMQVVFAADDTLHPPALRIEKIRAQMLSDAPAPVTQLAPPEPFEDPDELAADQSADQAEDADDEDEAEAEATASGGSSEEGDQPRRRRRRRRSRNRREDGSEAEPGQPASAEAAASEPTEGEGEAETEKQEELPPEEAPVADEAAAESDPEGEADAERRGRRGRRGGRRRRPADERAEHAAPAEAPPAVPSYVGPTPADPFAGSAAFDFFDAVERAEQARLEPAEPAVAQSVPEGELPPGHGGELMTAPEETDMPVLPPATAEAAAPEPSFVEIPEPPAPEPAVSEVPIAGVSSGELPAAEIPVAPTSDPEPPVPEQVVQETALPDAVVPEAALSAPAQPEAPAPEPAAEPQADEPPAAAPLIQPVLVGASDAPAEKRRGWWRR